MKTGFATSISSGDAQSAANTAIKSVNEQLSAEPALVFAFASTKQPLGQVSAALSAAYPNARILAASTAGEFTEAGDVKSSLSVVAINGDFVVHSGIGTNLKADPEAAVRAAMEGQPTEVAGYAHRSAIILLDPLAGNGEETVLLTAAVLGPDVVVAGGAAGDDLGMAETFVGCDSRTASDAVVIAQIFSKSALGLGVCHGHEALSETMTVTRAEGNVVHEVDGQPAWDVWKRATAAHAKARGVDTSSIATDDVGGFLLQYEAGVDSGSELKVRAPLSKDDAGALSFACGVPTGTEFRITESNVERQIASARTAAERAAAGVNGEVAGAVVFDCICRNLILDTEFKSAVGAMSEALGGAKLGGFETYGEVALAAGDLSGFHNTTSVVLAFPK